MRPTLGLTIALMLLAGCGERDERRAEGAAVEEAVRGNALSPDEPDPTASPTPTPTPSATPSPELTATPVADAWTGRWTGPEGMTLDIARDEAAGAGHYTLVNQYTLDEQGTFQGVADGDTIRFTRPDGEQALRATDGETTGMKWLAGKKDCLTVRTGEGYCRG